MLDKTTLTFVGDDRSVSDPIEVPLWSTITLSEKPGRPMIYMGTAKMILYSGAYEVDGKPYPAPAMHSLHIPAETRVIYPARQRVRKKRRTVTLPLWFVVLAGLALCGLYCSTIWFAIY
jgi:hypothetical protein